MSFASVFSLIATYTPTALGWFGYLGDVIGHFFVFIGIWLVNAFYNICRWFLAFVDFLQFFIQRLMGLDYWLSSGHKTIQGATDSDLLFSFLYNETVQDVFRALIGIFIVFLIIFTIFAIVKEEWKFASGADVGKGTNSKNKIIGSSLKAIALVIITPLIVLIGIISSNAILASIVKALNIDASTTFGNTIFSISAVSANKYRIYTDSQMRTAVSTDVTFYVKNGSVVRFGENNINTVSDYLEAIDGAKKYTVDSMFKKVVPSKSKDFYGYCIALGTGSDKKYYMVEVDGANVITNASQDKIDGMYYYLKYILGADIMAKNFDISNPSIYKKVSKCINSSSQSKSPCLIKGLDIDDCEQDEIFQACYNTWNYATIYQNTYSFDTTNSSVLEGELNKYGIIGVSNARTFYNSNDFGTYFDGGQFGAVQLNSEYGVMTDVIDFVCETGANLFVLDITSPLIKWDYEEYQIKSSLISENRNYYKNDYLPFIVDYSETAMDNEEGKVLYFAKKDVSNELEGSKFIMCWKISVDGTEQYVPLINRKTFIEPTSGQTFTFKSDYLANDYNGVVLAKGNFDDAITSSVNWPQNGDPTYLKIGSDISDGQDASEYQTKPYYFDMAKGKILSQQVSDILKNEKSATLTGVSYNNSNNENFEILDENRDGTFKIKNKNLGEYIDFTDALISDMTIKLSINGITDYLTYANIKNSNSDYYLFVSENTGNTVIAQVVAGNKLNIYGVNQNGNISAEKGKLNNGAIAVTSFEYKISIKQSGAGNTFNEIKSININPLGLLFSNHNNAGYSLFTSEERYYIDEIKQNISLNVYFNGDAIYYISDSGQLILQNAAPQNITYDLQMYEVKLYNFMTGKVGDVIKEYNMNGVLDTSISPIEIYSFGLFVDDFSWGDDTTDYDIYNGSTYIATLTKQKGVQVADADEILEKAISIRIDGNKYYSMSNSNQYDNDDDMLERYKTISNSLFVGCYRDRGTPDFITFDGYFALGKNFRFEARFCYTAIEKEHLMNESYGVFTLSEGISFDYFFEGNKSLMQFYNVFKVSYWIILIAAALIIKALGTALWGVIKRFYEITLCYLALPVTAAVIPLDNGAKFGSVQKLMIQNVLGAYGVILGINMFFVLLSPIKSISNIFTQAELDSSSSYFLRHFPFGAKILNNYVYILFVLVAFTMINSLPTLINSWVGGKDVVSEGNTTKKNVGTALKDSGDMISGKKAMDFGKKTIDTIGNTPLGQVVKWGTGKVKGAADKSSQYVQEGIAAAENSGSQQQSSSRTDDGENSSSNEQSETESNTPTESTSPTASTSARTTTAADDEQEIENDAAVEFNKGNTAPPAGNTQRGRRYAEAARKVAESGDKESRNAASDIADEIINTKKDLFKDGVKVQNSGMTEQEIVNLIRQLLGEEVEKLTDDEIKNNYKITFAKDDLTGKTVARINDGKNTRDLDENQNSLVDNAIITHADDLLMGQVYNQLVKKGKTEAVDAIAKNDSNVTFGSVYYNVPGKSSFVSKTTVNGSDVNALRLMDKYKNDENIENEVIYKKLENDGKLAKFLSETGLNSSSSKQDILEAIAKLKNSQNINEASVAFGVTKGQLTDELAQVMSEKVASGEIRATAWDLASETEKQEAINEQMRKKYHLTADEQEVADEIGAKNVRDLANNSSTKAEFEDKVVAEFLKNNSIENKDDISKDLILRAAGLDDIDSATYKASAKAINGAETSSGKKLNMKDLALQGYFPKDVMLAFEKLKLLADKNGQIDGVDIKNANGSFNADLILKMLQNSTDRNNEALEILAKNSAAKGIITESLMSGKNGTLPLLTSDVQDEIIKNIANSDRNRFADYDSVVAETKLRSQIDDIYAVQGDSINAAMLEQMKTADPDNYNALLSQINDMLVKAGKSKIVDFNDKDADKIIQDFINNEDNLGYIPIELENIKKNFIRDTLAKSDLSNVSDADNLSGQNRIDFDYKKEIIKDQIKSEGINSETLANLFQNSNFIGKDLLEKEINKLATNMLLNPANKGKSGKEVYDMAFSEIMKDRDDIKDILLNIGATDITKSISKDNLSQKQIDIAKNDAVLSKQLTDAGVNIKDDKEIKNYIDSNKNASFSARLGEKIDGMIDPSKQVTDSDKERFFGSRQQSDAIDKYLPPIQLGLSNSQKQKLRNKLPKTHKKYDEWNDLINKDIEAVKSGKGVYASMSKDERKTKLDELKSKLIDENLPDDYYSLSLEERQKYDENQNLLKNQALNVNISKLVKKNTKVTKMHDRNALVRFANGMVDKSSGIPVLGAVTTRFISEDLRRKHEKDLLFADEQISRFNSTAAMRNRERDFGTNFYDYASSYFDAKTINNIKKQLIKRGIKDADVDESALKTREEEFAKQLNKNYKVAKTKVARDNRVDADVLHDNNGANVGGVRYKDGTKKYTQIRSRLGKKTANTVEQYDNEYLSGSIADKTHKKYVKSDFYKRGELAAIQYQNQQKLYDQIREFNRTYKGDGKNYAKDFEAMFGKDVYDKIYKKFNKLGLTKLENSPAVVQQREVLRRLEKELKKNQQRQNSSGFIPADSDALNKYKAQTYTNAKTKSAIEHDKDMMEAFKEAMQEFKRQLATGKGVNANDLLNNVNPAVLGKKLKNFNNMNENEIRNYLEYNFKKYQNRVINNTFTPNQAENLTKLNGVYIDKSKAQNSRLSNAVIKSLSSTQSDVYKNIIKSLNSANVKVNSETQNLNQLKKTLSDLQTGIQSNAAKKQIEQIKKAIANSEIRLNNLKGVQLNEMERKRVFEQAIASDRIKKAIRDNAANMPRGGLGGARSYTRMNGSARPIAPGSIDQKQVEALEKRFMAHAKSELDYMLKSMSTKQNEEFKKEIRKTAKKLSYDAKENLRQIRSLQAHVKKEISKLATKTDNKSKQDKLDLQTQNQKLDDMIKRIVKEFAKMDIMI